MSIPNTTSKRRELRSFARAEFTMRVARRDGSACDGGYRTTLAAVGAASGEPYVGRLTVEWAWLADGEYLVTIERVG